MVVNGNEWFGIWNFKFKVSVCKTIGSFDTLRDTALIKAIGKIDKYLIFYNLETLSILRQKEMNKNINT